MGVCVCVWGVCGVCGVCVCYFRDSFSVKYLVDLNIRKHNIGYQMFADHVQLYVSFNSKGFQVFERMKTYQMSLEHAIPSLIYLL